MRWTRLAAVVVVLVTLGVGATKAVCVESAFPPAVPCNASALAGPYSGDLKVVGVASFGCVGRWAYLWATVGKGVHEIGVTEVLHFDLATNSWRNASRLTYCGHHLIPKYVDFWGCNSN